MCLSSIETIEKTKILKMYQLNLPVYNFKIKTTSGKLQIFDAFRKKYVVLTPEEWVRQHFIRFLVEVKNYPFSLIAIEKQLYINGMKKRFDAVLYDFEGKPKIIIEFKAPNIKISQQTFDQAAIYNSKLQVEFLFLSNGIEHYFCKVDSENSKYVFFSEIPDFKTLFI